MKRLLVFFLVAVLMVAQSNVARVGQTNTWTTGTQDWSAAAHTLPAKVVANVAALPATCVQGEQASVTAATAGSQIYTCGPANTWTQVVSAGTPSVVSHSINLVFNGGSSSLTGDNGFFPGNGPLTGTISRVDISGAGTAGAACSITVDVWKANAAIPASGNKISASAPATLSSANLSQSGSLSGWSTAVAANDVWSGTVATNTGCITALVQVWYQ